MEMKRAAQAAIREVIRPGISETKPLTTHDLECQPANVLAAAAHSKAGHHREEFESPRKGTSVLSCAAQSLLIAQAQQASSLK